MNRDVILSIEHKNSLVAELRQIGKLATSNLSAPDNIYVEIVHLGAAGLKSTSILLSIRRLWSPQDYCNKLAIDFNNDGRINHWILNLAKSSKIFHLIFCKRS